MIDFQVPDFEALKNSLVSEYVMIAGVVVVILIAVLLVIGWKYNLYESFVDSGTTSSSSSSSSSASKDLEIYFFYTDWCPHCKTAKPEWEHVKGEMDGKQVNGNTLRFVDVNCTNETPEVDQLMKTYSVEGYPTIKAVKNGDIIDYDAKPNKETLAQFINGL
jgi:thiol-disulfide isomerase/thioredoxin